LQSFSDLLCLDCIFRGLNVKDKDFCLHRKTNGYVVVISLQSIFYPVNTRIGIALSFDVLCV
ncbi:AAEL013247-PA, partial [Aedes aegypti]